METLDCVVIGAGVIGLAIARALAQRGRQVWLLERNPRHGEETSSRNSEVIHAGLYYPSGSLKAQLCRRGNELLYHYCQSRQIPHRRLGKWLLASQADEQPALQRLATQAHANGVDNLQWIEGRTLQQQLPGLRTSAALFSPDTGILDSQALMLTLLADLQQAGGQWVPACTVDRFERQQGYWDLWLAAGERIACRTLINAAGAHAHALSEAAGLSTPTLYPCKGHYFSYQGPHPFRQLVYPMPAAHTAGLGVHATLDLNGQLRFGPDTDYLEGDAGTPPFDYRVDAERRHAFARAISHYWPGLQSDRLQPAYAGVRPKLSGPGMAAADFRIDGPHQHQQAELVQLFGIESPGLTACLAIAEQVCHTLAGD